MGGFASEVFESGEVVIVGGLSVCIAVDIIKAIVSTCLLDISILLRFLERS